MKNIVALVTGAASGLGKATATGLLLHGARVIGLDTNYHEDKESNFKQLFSEDDAKSKPFLKESCAFVKGDVVSVTDVESALNIASKNWGHITVVVNCVGLPAFRVIYNPLTDRCIPLDAFRSVMNTNISGTFNVVRLAAQQMAKNDLDSKQQRGVIINTSSIDAFNGMFGASTLSASAGAVASMTLPLARDLSSLGIRVMSIAPGYFDTPLVDHPEAVKTFLANSNIFPHCIGDPKLFFDCVLTVIENQMLNGEVIRLDAGCHFPVRKTAGEEV